MLKIANIINIININGRRNNMPGILKQRITRILLSLVILVLLIMTFLSVTTRITEQYAHISPPYPKTDISHVLAKDTFNEEDYKLLFYQTGLGKPAIDELKEMSGNFAETVLKFQDNFFRKIDFICEKNSPISREESVIDNNGNYIAGTDIASIHNGYILLTKSSHTYGWRNGHAALVIDAARGKTLESVVLGTKSCIQSIDKWTNYPNFILMRPKNVPLDLLEEIAQSASEILRDVDYDLFTGIFSLKNKKPGNVNGTYCSHLVWQAFKFFGIDLDSDGGIIVTPKDIAKSPYLEIVQVYGVDPGNIWP